MSEKLQQRRQCCLIMLKMLKGFEMEIRRYIIAIGRLVYSNERNSQNCESADMQLSVSRRKVNYFGGL